VFIGWLYPLSVPGTLKFTMKNNSVIKRIASPKNIIAAGCRHTVVLKSDGTVTAVGDNKYGQCDLHSWHDIVAVAAGNVHMAANTGNAHTVGLKSGGTVVAVGNNDYSQCDVK